MDYSDLRVFEKKSIIFFFAKQIIDYQGFIYLCVSQLSDFFPLVFYRTI